MPAAGEARDAEFRAFKGLEPLRRGHLLCSVAQLIHEAVKHTVCCGERDGKRSRREWAPRAAVSGADGDEHAVAKAARVCGGGVRWWHPAQVAVA